MHRLRISLIKRKSKENLNEGIIYCEALVLVFSLRWFLVTHPCIRWCVGICTALLLFWHGPGVPWWASLMVCILLLVRRRLWRLYHESPLDLGRQQLRILRLHHVQWVLIRPQRALSYILMIWWYHRHGRRTRNTHPGLCILDLRYNNNCLWMIFMFNTMINTNPMLLNKKNPISGKKN